MFPEFQVQCVLPLLLFTLQPSGGEVLKYFKVDRFGNCESAEQYPIVFQPEFNVKSIGGINSFNCTIRVCEEIAGPLKYEANIQRCEMDFSKCEFFNLIEEPDLCRRFGEVEFQRLFLNGATMPVACPLQPGDYNFTDNQWDMSPIVNLPGSAYRWKIKATVTQLATGRVVYCTDMMARIVVTRKKGNRGKGR